MRDIIKKILKFKENNTVRFGDEDIFRYWISTTGYRYRVSAIICFITPHPFSLSRNTENMKPVGWNIGNFSRHLTTRGQTLEFTTCENYWIFEKLQT